MTKVKKSSSKELFAVKYLKYYWKDDFWRNSLIFFAGSMLVGFINYLYFPFISRLMSVNNFGEIQALFSILIYIGTLFAALSIVIISITTNTKNNFKQAKIVELEQMALYIALIAGVPWLFGSMLLKDFLQMTSIWPIILIYPIFVLSLLTSTRQSFLQGRQDFLGTSIGQNIIAIAKLLLSIILVIAGFKVMGAITGLITAYLIGLIFITNRATKKGLKFKILPLKRPKWYLLTPQLKLGLPILAVSLSVAIIYSADIIAIKHYFNPTIAGQYAGIATVGRILLFITGSISAVMFASIKIKNSTKQNHKLLIRSMLILCLVGGVALTVFALFPNQVIKLLVGYRYLPQATLLPKLSLALFLVSLLNLVLLYHLALRYTKIAILAVAGAVLMIVLNVAFHDSIGQIVNNILYSTIIMLIISVIISLLKRPRLISSKYED